MNGPKHAKIVIWGIGAFVCALIAIARACMHPGSSWDRGVNNQLAETAANTGFLLAIVAVAVVSLLLGMAVGEIQTKRRD